MCADEVLAVGDVLQEERRGWSRPCPKCASEIRYTVLNLNAGVEPFLYCDQGSDFVLRQEDRQAVLASAGENPSLKELRAFYKDLERRLPPCPGGGRFRIWSNIKCPVCGFEFPYASGRRNELVRFFESKVVWVEGAFAFRGGRLASSRLVKVKVV